MFNFKHFHARTQINQFPRKLIMFRDGVNNCQCNEERSRGKRYHHLLCHDSDLTTDELQYLTSLMLCYGYSRWTRAVGIPSATYYAQLAAYRVRNIMDMDPLSPQQLAQSPKELMEMIDGKIG